MSKLTEHYGIKAVPPTPEVKPVSPTPAVALDDVKQDDLFDQWFPPPAPAEAPTVVDAVPTRVARGVDATVAPRPLPRPEVGDPRPDLPNGRLWDLLLRGLYAIEGDPPHGIYVKMHGLRCQDAVRLGPPSTNPWPTVVVLDQGAWLSVRGPLVEALKPGGDVALHGQAKALDLVLKGLR